MGQKDIISKQLIQRIAVDLAVYLLELDIEFDDLELLSTEKQRVEDRRADLVAKVNHQAESFVLHIEIQNNNDANMPLRMLRYYTDIALAHSDLPIRQYVIYIGKAALQMPAYKKDSGLNYHYTIINMHNIDYLQLLKQDSPDAIVLAILCDFNADSEHEAVTRIVRQLHGKLHLDPKRLREYMYMMEILSDNRNLKTAIKKAETVITDINIENLPSYELGMEKGLATGMERGIERGMENGVEKGIQQMIKQLLIKNSPKKVAELTEMSLSEVLAVKNLEKQ
jgi:predicted transposase YdaD